jgi:hypothetical protein
VNNLARLYRRIGNFEKALRSLEECFGKNIYGEAAPFHEECLVERKILLAGQGDDKRSVPLPEEQHFQKCMSGFGENHSSSLTTQCTR